MESGQREIRNNVSRCGIAPSSIRSTSRTTLVVVLELFSNRKTPERIYLMTLVKNKEEALRV
jgi:hypothetical protein